MSGRKLAYGTEEGYCAHGGSYFKFVDSTNNIAKVKQFSINQHAIGPLFCFSIHLIVSSLINTGCNSKAQIK